ncbi:ABC transporter ATP-binding protein [Eubacterium sp. 1001713B170207_170306_E7]|uniref:ABC transporter ATP-binding protein n=1 Tax=Eubacterium sp. 1001713B170207_170306_E7 TaxID=2787097 RepID=UPI00189806E2|nr:ABC transporter ATP-binding protein [Eubacterium sp. 1001713B170207_170306_E7]
MEILRAEHLHKVYKNGSGRVEALRDVCLSAEKGELVAVTGPSGSGKSTLLHLIGGVEDPTAGTVHIGGVDIHRKTRAGLAVFRRRQIGLVYQFYNLIPSLSVEDNILLPLRLDGRRVNRDYLEELLCLLKLQDLAGQLPGALSGGEQQRAAIGRALIAAPVLVLADEPTGSLDRRGSQEIMGLFKISRQKYKQTIIIVTHDEDIARQADRRVEICDGRLAGAR